LQNENYGDGYGSRERYIIDPLELDGCCFEIEAQDENIKDDLPFLGTDFSHNSKYQSTPNSSPSLVTDEKNKSKSSPDIFNTKDSDEPFIKITPEGNIVYVTSQNCNFQEDLQNINENNPIKDSISFQPTKIKMLKKHDDKKSLVRPPCPKIKPVHKSKYREIKYTEAQDSNDTAPAWFVVYEESRKNEWIKFVTKREEQDKLISNMMKQNNECLSKVFSKLLAVEENLKDYLDILKTERTKNKDSKAPEKNIQKNSKIQESSTEEETILQTKRKRKDAKYQECLELLKPYSSEKKIVLQSSS
ncbi:unnamed protein product, partial [Meganyctiphanes norvegica]